ncbi:MAG: hypothetical protein GY940_02330 [bacterium]|nr:hypothetical protein [bacterium]
MTKRFILTAIFLYPLLMPVWVGAESKVSIALQPFGTIEKAVLEEVAVGLKNQFNDLSVEIRPPLGLPKSAYYKPGKRYRAEKLIRYLETYYRFNAITGYTRIIGITDRDISITDERNYDKSVFGYASLHTGPGVVSIYRFKRRSRSYGRWLKLLVKTVVHELGHTFGLDHCPTPGCVMQDADRVKKKLRTSNIHFCQRCRPVVEGIFKRTTKRGGGTGK